MTTAKRSSAVAGIFWQAERISWIVEWMSFTSAVIVLWFTKKKKNKKDVQVCVRKGKTKGKTKNIKIRNLAWKVLDQAGTPSLFILSSNVKTNGSSLPFAARETVVRSLEKSNTSGKCWHNDLTRMCRNVDFPSTVFVVLSWWEVEPLKVQEQNKEGERQLEQIKHLVLLVLCF